MVLPASLKKMVSLTLRAFQGPAGWAAHVCSCLSISDTRRTPHYTKLHRQTSANTIHHHGTGMGGEGGGELWSSMHTTLNHSVSKRPCFTKRRTFKRKQWCKLKRGGQPKLAPTRELPSASQQSHTHRSPSKSELNGCYFFQESIEQLWRLTTHYLFTALLHHCLFDQRG